MGSEHDTGNFLSASQSSQAASPGTSLRAGQGGAFSPSPTSSGSPTRLLPREELDTRVSETQQRLNELRHAQEHLERERSLLEEARRRRSELQHGRQELTTNLARGIVLLEKSEFDSRQNAEQMAKTLVEFRKALETVRAINEESWSDENWNVELTKSLTALENARMEWNSARLKWPVLSSPSEGTSEGSQGASPLQSPQTLAGLRTLGFAELCKIGIALTWPIALVGMAILIGLIFLLRK